MFNKLRRSKRGDVIFTLFAFAFLIAIITFYTASALFGPRYYTEYIGQISQQLLESSHKTERALIYIDQAGKYAAFQAIYDLGDGGGYNVEPECGVYKGYTIWFDEGGNECYPNESIEKEFGNEMNEKLGEYFDVYEEETIMMPYNYKFEVEEKLDGQEKVLDIKGKATEMIQTAITSEGVNFEAVFLSQLQVYTKIGLEWSVPIDPANMEKVDGKLHTDPFMYPGRPRYEENHYPARYKSIHRGIDIFPTRAGIPVMAIADGVVTWVSHKEVIVSHKGVGGDKDKIYTSIYAHVAADETLLNKKVARGKIIGKVLDPKTIGATYPPHVHLEMYSTQTNTLGKSSIFANCACKSNTECDLRCTTTKCDKDAMGGCFIREDDQYLIDPVDIISYN